MAQVAYKISRTVPELKLILGGLTGSRSSRVQDTEASPTREMFILAGLMILLQIMDGVLTAVGVGHFGTFAEGNPVLRVLMHSVGQVPALIVAKSVAIFVVLALLALSVRVPWISTALKVMIGIYLVAAVLPWTGIILFKIV